MHRRCRLPRDRRSLTSAALRPKRSSRSTPASRRWMPPRAVSSRHRLNPSGNRQLNAALHMIALTQARLPGPPGPTSRGAVAKEKPGAKPCARSSATSSAPSIACSENAPNARPRASSTPAPRSSPASADRRDTTHIGVIALRIQRRYSRSWVARAARSANVTPRRATVPASRLLRRAMPPQSYPQRRPSGRPQDAGRSERGKSALASLALPLTTRHGPRFESFVATCRRVFVSASSSRPTCGGLVRRQQSPMRSLRFGRFARTPSS